MEITVRTAAAATMAEASGFALTLALISEPSHTVTGGQAAVRSRR